MEAAVNQDQIHQRDDEGYDATMDRLWKRAMGDVENFFDLVRAAMPDLEILQLIGLFHFDGEHTEYVEVFARFTDDQRNFRQISEILSS